MKKRAILLLIAVLSLYAGLAGAGDLAVPAKPGPKERCPVCGMFVAKYSSWLSAATFRDGSVAYFDGPKDLFRYFFAVERFDQARKASDVEDLFVTDYYSTQLMRAKEAFFVRGSDVMGPMGPELVPLKSAEEAKTFSIDHQGAEILSFQEITPQVMSKLKPE
jgi:copper chaperone NosL